MTQPVHPRSQFLIQKGQSPDIWSALLHVSIFSSHLLFFSDLVALYYTCCTVPATVFDHFTPQEREEQPPLWESKRNSIDLDHSLAPQTYETYILLARLKNRQPVEERLWIQKTVRVRICRIKSHCPQWSLQVDVFRLFKVSPVEGAWWK